MNRLSISALSAINYKNLDIKDGVDLSNLNILIGPNGCGKSNFIALLQFLKYNIYGVGSQWIDHFEYALRVMDGTNALNKNVNAPARVNLSYHFSPNEEIIKGLTFSLELLINKINPSITIAEESLSDSSQLNPTPFYFYRNHNRQVGEGVVSVYVDDRKTPSHFEVIENVPTNSLGFNSLIDLLADSKNPPERTPFYKIRKQFSDNIKGWGFFNANDMDLRKIKTSLNKISSQDYVLVPNGQNLASVVDNYINSNIDFEDKLNYAMKSILPTSRRIRSKRFGTSKVGLEWYFDNIKDSFFLNEMSDGTVRMLCWATVLLSPNVPTLLVIEEPELGIHPAWMPVLADWIKEASRKTQVIISTHSPNLLDHFTECIQNVFVFTSQDQISFSIKPLSKEKIQDKFEEGWKLGDLYRVGEPNIGGWPC